MVTVHVEPADGKGLLTLFIVHASVFLLILVLLNVVPFTTILDQEVDPPSISRKNCCPPLTHLHCLKNAPPKISTVLSLTEPYVGALF